MLLPRRCNRPYTIHAVSMTRMVATFSQRFRLQGKSRKLYVRKCNFNIVILYPMACSHCLQLSKPCCSVRKTGSVSVCAVHSSALQFSVKSAMQRKTNACGGCATRELISFFILCLWQLAALAGPFDSSGLPMTPEPSLSQQYLS